MKTRNRVHPLRTIENITFLARILTPYLDVAQTTLHRILHKYFGLKTFKDQLTQELKLIDHQTSYLR